MAVAPFEHADEAGEALRQIAAECGLGVLSDPAMMTSLLADLLPAAPGVVRILVAAAEDRVAEAVRDRMSQGLDLAAATTLIASSFAKTSMFTPDMCTWVVGELAAAMGLAIEIPGKAPAVAVPEPREPAGPPAVLTELGSALDALDALTADAGAARAAPAAAAPADTAGFRRGRRRWLVPVAAVVALAATAGAVAVWAPWFRPPAPVPPVLRPSGLTIGSSTFSSAVFSWSGPSRGPAPDRYVIFQDGAAIGSVPGTVTSYEARGLAPDTSYHYQVIAVRDGRRSARSAVLTADTLIPPISAAVLEGPWTVRYKVITSSVHELSYLVGKKWTDSWDFSPNCGKGRCPVSLSGIISGPGNVSDTPFTVTLKRTGAVYTGTTRTDRLEYCNYADVGRSAPIHTTVRLRIKVSQAATVGLIWGATSWAGTMTIDNSYTPAGSTYCLAYSWSALLRSNF